MPQAHDPTCSVIMVLVSNVADYFSKTAGFTLTFLSFTISSFRGFGLTGSSLFIVYCVILYIRVGLQHGNEGPVLPVLHRNPQVTGAKGSESRCGTRTCR